MSKKRGRPSKAKEISEVRIAPAAPELPDDKATPQAVPAPAPKAADIPAPPRHISAMSHIPRKRWGVPMWLILLAAYTGSEYGAKMPARNNALGIMARGTEKKNEDGEAWFPNLNYAFDRFGWICRNLKLDYSKPEKCVEALKDRCPNIDSVSYKIFMEA